MQGGLSQYDACYRTVCNSYAVPIILNAYSGWRLANSSDRDSISSIKPAAYNGYVTSDPFISFMYGGGGISGIPTSSDLDRAANITSFVRSMAHWWACDGVNKLCESFAHSNIDTRAFWSDFLAISVILVK